MMRSLFAGVSGLQNHQIRMDVVGNNISNVNTTGFKKGRVNFQDMISQTMSGAAKPTENKGGVNPKQVGLGMMIATIDTIHTQGSLQTTGNNLDMALSGNGFFILKDGDKTFFTRAGAFSLDKDGLLVNPASGLKVQGWNSREVNGEFVMKADGSPSDIKIPLYSKDPAKQTTNVDFKCNLMAQKPIVEDLNALTQGERDKNTWQSSIDIYDSQGNTYESRYTFYKSNTNEWRARVEMFQKDPNNPELRIQIPNDQFSLSTNATEGESNAAVTNPNQNEFIMRFDNLGRLASVSDLDAEGNVLDTKSEGELFFNINLNVPNTTPDSPGQNINIQMNMGVAGQVSTSDRIGVTQFASGFSTKPFRQDGYGMGYLEGFKIDDTGTITGVFSNGNNRALAQLALANFVNVQGLEKAGETNFVMSNNSGEADIAQAGTVGLGKIIAGTLEMSNVDLADQFTDMIVTQRGFQANSKTIQTADQMIQELLSLKR